MLTDDIDAEQIIARLCGQLSPPDRAAFRRAAEDALAKLPCAGEGLVWRIAVGLWRNYFHPPSDTETGQPIGPASRRSSKLIGDEDAKPRDRRRLRLVG